MQLEPIRAVLTADAGQFVQGMNKAQTSMGMLSVSSAQSHKAMTVLRNGMVGLAAQATGTQGPVGKLAQAMLLFGGGGTLVLGVAAGIGAISLVYQGLTRDSKEAAKAQEDLIKALQGVGIHAQLMAAKIKLSMLKTKQEGGQTVGEVFSQFLSDMTGGMFGTSREEQKGQIARDIAGTLNQISALEQQVAKWQQQIADDANREADARLRSLMALDKMAMKMPSKESVERFSTEQRDKILGLGGKHDQGPFGSLNELGNKMRFGLEQSGISENMREFGISVGRQFAMGMLEGIQSMRDLLKMVIMSVLDFGLGAILNAIIPGAGVGGGVKGSPAVGPASMSLNMSGMPAAATPMAAARDAQWQSFLRESVLVAKSQGFHG